MKIAILNANPEPSPFDAFLDQVQGLLESAGHPVTAIPLRDRDIRYCAGCFGCWVKTPGECALRDDGPEFRRAVIRSDFTLLASPLRMEFPSALLKKSIDRFLPLLHPYFVSVHGEAHHRGRYARYPRFGLLLEKEAGTDALDLEIVTDIFRRAALNMRSSLEFALTTDADPADLVRRILHIKGSPAPLAPRRAPILGAAIDPPARITLFNGSARGRAGSTAALLEKFAAGFLSIAGKTAETRHLLPSERMENFLPAFAEAECVWLGTPLYYDSMPGHVKAFLEALEPLRGRRGNPPVGFLIQSGFPEGLHSRYLERYFEKFAERIGAPYLGTIVKGASSSSDKPFGALFRLGRGLAERGALAPRDLRAAAGLERFPAFPDFFWNILLRLANVNGYFESLLVQNGAFESRFATPYLDHS